MNRKGVVLDEAQDPQVTNLNKRSLTKTFNKNKYFYNKFKQEDCAKILRTMIVLQKLDNVMYEAQRQGRISFYMPNQGETAAQLGSAHALDSNDLVFGEKQFLFVSLIF